MNNFPENHVAIHSVPRSGSSWLGQIFKSSPQVEFRFQPLFSYAFKDFLNARSSGDDIREFMRAIYESDDDFIHQRIPDLYVEYPEFQERRSATHLVWKEVRYHHVIKNMMEKAQEVKLIGLVRHPCAVIDSWLHAPREFKSGWKIEEEWRDAPSKNQNRPEEFNGFTKWMEVAQLFLELQSLYPSRFKVIRYKDLNEETLPTVDDLFSFCGLRLGPETIQFIRQSRSKEGSDPNSIYRKPRKDIQWQDRLPVQISDTIIKEASNAGLERFLE